MVEQLILHTNYLTPHKLVLLVILTKFCNYEYTGIAVHMIIRYLITSIQVCVIFCHIPHPDIISDFTCIY